AARACGPLESAPAPRGAGAAGVRGHPDLSGARAPAGAAALDRPDAAGDRSTLRVGRAYRPDRDLPAAAGRVGSGQLDQPVFLIALHQARALGEEGVHQLELRQVFLPRATLVHDGGSRVVEEDVV